MPRIAAVATQVPPHVLRQEEARGYAERLLSQGSPELLRLLTVFDNAGVQTRYLAEPVPWYFGGHGWRDRADAFSKTGLDLLEGATRKALDAAKLGPREIDGVVLITSTGISTPSLDARLANRLGLRDDLLRVPVWGLGCAGGVAGLARAADLATARPKGRFLLLSLELCSLAFLRERFTKKMVVAASLFGDGCAAAIVEGDEAPGGAGPSWVASQSHLWPQTERVMGWDVLDEGLDVVFDPIIPQFVRENMGPPMNGFINGRSISAYAMHPGGAKVLDALEHTLGLPSGALEESRAVLREFGNMSSPTFLFVLERILRTRGSNGHILAGALGPGFACELALLEGGSP